MKYIYKGSDFEGHSLAFNAIDTTGDAIGYGVFDFPEEIDPETGQVLQPARPYFTHYFGQFFITGVFVMNQAKFNEACDSYIHQVVSWAFPQRPIRVIIPNELVTRAQVASASHTGDMLDYLGQIIDSVYPSQADFIVVDETNATIYLNFLLTEHEAVLRSFSEIVIEYITPA